MAAGQSHAKATYRLDNRLTLLARNRTHGPYGYDKVESAELIGIQESIQRVGYFNIKVVRGQQACKALGDLLRFMTIPTAVYY